MILLIAKTPEKSKDLMLDGDRLSIGRDPANEVFLEDPRASRVHARIERKKEGYLLIDAGSRNGTHVGKQRVDRRILKPDDIISIGGSIITVLAIKAGSPPAKPAPSNPSTEPPSPSAEKAPSTPVTPPDFPGPAKPSSEKISLSGGKEIAIASKPTPVSPETPEPSSGSSRAANARKILTDRVRYGHSPEPAPRDLPSIIKAHFGLILVLFILIGAGFFLPAILNRLHLVERSKETVHPAAISKEDLHELQQLKDRASGTASISDLLLLDAKRLADKYASLDGGKNRCVEFHRSLLYRRANQRPSGVFVPPPDPPAQTDAAPADRVIPDNLPLAGVFPIPRLIDRLQTALTEGRELPTGDLPGKLLKIETTGVTIRTSQEDQAISWNMISPETIWTLCSSVSLGPDETIVLCRYGFEKELRMEAELLLQRYVAHEDEARKEKADRLIAESRGEPLPEGGYVWSSADATFIPAPSR